MYERGYIVLISVLIAGAIAVAAALSVILLGLSSSRTSFASTQSAQAAALSNACAEEGLRRIQLSASYTGSGSISQGNCSYTVTSQGGGNRTVIASSTVGTIVRKVKVLTTQVSPVAIISTWQEVADF